MYAYLVQFVLAPRIAARPTAAAPSRSRPTTRTSPTPTRWSWRCAPIRRCDPGDQVFVTLDGQALNDGRPTGAQFTISPVERGTHVLQAAVRDSGGALLCQTSGVSYSVHQPSVLNPANPVRPR